jgi:hypothetical protein
VAEEMARWRATRAALRLALKLEFGLPESLARQAVAEAESVATLTEIPRFAVWILAEEKAATLQRWHRQQLALLARTAPRIERLGVEVRRNRPGTGPELPHRDVAPVRESTPDQGRARVEEPTGDRTVSWSE